MGKRVVLGGLLAILSGCGGHIDNDRGLADPQPAADAADEQGLYQPVNPGGPDRVADDVGSPSAIAMTDESVLFTTQRTRLSGELVEAGAIFVADKRLGPPQMLGIDRQGASYDALATDGTTAFIATSDARIVSVSVAGGEMTKVADLDAPAIALSTFGNYVYVATDMGELARVAKTGGAAEHLATITGDIRGLEADDAAVYVATGKAEETPAGIVSVTLDGTDMKILASGAEPCAMIRDGRRLFWTSLGAAPGAPMTPAKGEVRSLSLDGGEVATVASGSFSACAIAADHDSLYFATTVPNALRVRAGDSAGGTGGLGLMRAPIGGGQPVAVAEASHALAQPGAVAVDGSHVYWLTESAVLRLKK